VNLKHTTIYTIGHSTWSLEGFLGLLSAHNIQCIADVRQQPTAGEGSHFSSDTLIRELTPRHIAYCWLPNLEGKGRERPGRRTADKAQESAFFRDYADYMLTTDFANAFRALLTLAQNQRTAMMCTEANWRRCHRRLIADHLVRRGIEVLHIIDTGPPQEHSPLQVTRVKRGRPTYPR